eukprot:7052014-Pyramimonas_sp.AAC.1
MEKEPGHEPELWGASIDLQDGFYQFLAPTVSHFFGLGVCRRAGDVGVTEVFDPELNASVAVDPSDELEVCFGGLPMGWSWA